MTPKEIIEWNRLIAEFMGAKYRVDTYMMYEMPDDLVAILGCMCFEQLDKMKFHSSWDWLMPVVEKIKTIGFSFEIDTWSGVSVYNFSKNFKPESKIEVVLEDDEGNKIDLIRAIYIAVIEFIKWYNQTKK